MRENAGPWLCSYGDEICVCSPGEHRLQYASISSAFHGEFKEAIEAFVQGTVLLIGP